MTPPFLRGVRGDLTSVPQPKENCYIYTISGFAAAKRDIFNWWIIEIIPSAYCLKLPPTFYSRDLQFLPLIKYSEATVG